MSKLFIILNKIDLIPSNRVQPFNMQLKMLMRGVSMRNAVLLDLQKQPSKKM